MPLKHIMVHLDSSPRCEARVDIALNLAVQAGARLTGVFAEADTDAAPTALDSFESAARARGVTTDARTIPATGHSQIIKQISWAVRDSDMAVLGQNDPDHATGRVPEDLVEQAVLHAGRPVLAIPYAGTFTHVGRRVLIGWNGSRESTRALNDGLPLMAEAGAVRLLSINPPREALKNEEALTAGTLHHLEAHGIKAEVLHEPNNDVRVADLLVTRAADFGADLMVMGAHGHYGFPHILRGGVTRDLLGQITVPTLLSH